MFQSLSLKSQATRLGELLSQHGVALSRSQKLEALAYVHGAANWQTLHSATQAAVSDLGSCPVHQTAKGRYVFGTRSDKVLHLDPSGPWTLVVHGNGEECLTLSEQTERDICLATFEAELLEGEKQVRTVWAEHVERYRRLLGFRLHDVPAAAVNVSVFPIREDGVAHPAHTWTFEHDLSTSEGDFNFAQLERKPYFGSHEFDVDAWNKCLEVLRFDTDGYIGRLDEKLGVYFEMEYMCQESESEPGEEPVNFPTFAERVAQLQRTHAPLVKKFPQVTFAVSNDESLTWEGRPCVWAFIPATQLSVELAKKVADELFNLAFPDESGAAIK